MVRITRRIEAAKVASVIELDRTTRRPPILARWNGPARCRKECAAALIAIGQIGIATLPEQEAIVRFGPNEPGSAASHKRSKGSVPSAGGGGQPTSIVPPPERQMIARGDAGDERKRRQVFLRRGNGRGTLSRCPSSITAKTISKSYARRLIQRPYLPGYVARSTLPMSANETLGGAR